MYLKAPLPVYLKNLMSLIILLLMNKLYKKPLKFLRENMTSQTSLKQEVSPIQILEKFIKHTIKNIKTTILFILKPMGFYVHK